LAGHPYEHDVEVCSRYGMLGSIDANTGDTSLGWDTDQFPMNLRDCAYVMKKSHCTRWIGSRWFKVRALS